MGPKDMMSNFEWDPKKALSNVRKHDVPFEEAATVFDHPEFITVMDEAHSVDEERYITIGLSASGHLLVVAHTERGDATRIVSARKATRNEEKFYQEAG
jgi:uncharacterized DUF497 family protein